MKRNKLFGIGAAALMIWGLSSCSNELNGPSAGHTNGVNSPVISPDVVAWSGNQTFTPGVNGNAATSVNTRGVDVNGNLWYQNWDRPTNVTAEEIAKVLEAVKEPIYETNEIKIDWHNYWVQQVYTGEAEYQDGYGNWLNDNGQKVPGSYKMDHLLAYSSKKSQYSHWDQELEKNVYDIVDKGQWDDKYEHVNNFNHGSNNTVYIDDVTKQEFIGTTLMTDMYAEDIDAQHQFGYHNSTDSKDHFEYIIIEVDGYYYVCFDFYATHPEGQEANKNMDVERDYIYNDWIVRISPAYPAGTNSDNPGGVTNPTNPNPGKTTCDKCDHPSHEPGECPECKDEPNCNHSECNPKDDPNSPKIPEGAKIFDCPLCRHAAIYYNGEYYHLYDWTREGEPCSKCKDEHKDSECTDDDLREEMARRAQQGENPTPGTGTTPQGPNNKYTQKEVEINLSVNDIHELPNGGQKYDIADLVSKLSIHVRYGHDVEVILPVPENIYCDQDDLYILKDHNNGNYNYGGEEHNLVYVIEGYVKDASGNKTPAIWNVKLGIQYITADQDNLTNKAYNVQDKDGNDIVAGGYIRVYTEGICQELIDYLRENYGDGINFEVYNYFNKGTQNPYGNYNEITYESLQYNYLSHSFVNFDWNYKDRHGDNGHEANCNPETPVYPDFYINAFKNTSANVPNKGDCYVWIMGDSRSNNGLYLNNGKINNGYPTVFGDQTQRSAFWNPYQGTHLNGSPFNWIYTNKQQVTGSVDSNDMPTTPETWPFGNSDNWQYYKVNGNPIWNWGTYLSPSTGTGSETIE